MNLLKEKIAKETSQSMHITNEPKAKAAQSMTTRELVDAFDELIQLRQVCSKQTDEKERKFVEEQIEVLKRQMADTLKTHFAAKGVYIEPK